MLNSEREFAIVGNPNGHGAATAAGERPREFKHQAKFVSNLLSPDSNGQEAPESLAAPTENTSKQSEHPDSTLTNAVSMLGSLRAEKISDLVAKTEDGSAASPPEDLVRNVSSTLSTSGESNPTNLAPITPSPDVPSIQKAAILMETKTGSIPMTIATGNGVPTSGTGVPLLASGLQTAKMDRRRNRTRPLPTQNDTSPAASKLLTSDAQTPSHAKPKTGGSLRRGKWTVEEEEYVARVIQDFNSGFLMAPAGTTLRSYLSEKLQCDPMRITKKFTGDSCIGKRVFHPAVRNPSNAAAIDKAQAEVDSLERRWRRRLEMQQRESAKKAAAATAAAAATIAAPGRSHGFVTHGSYNGTVIGGQNAASAQVVTQTASWLDRASNILKDSGSQTGDSPPCSHKFSLTEEQAQALQSLPREEIEMQMKEVERLIHEGPIIQQTTAELPLALYQSSPELLQQQPPDIPTTMSIVHDGQQTPPEPADKRMRTGAEDAEALVGFLTAVRASAAAGLDTFSCSN